MVWLPEASYWVLQILQIKDGPVPDTSLGEEGRVGDCCFIDGLGRLGNIYQRRKSIALGRLSFLAKIYPFKEV